MKRGRNSVSIACTLELINLIKTHSGKEDMNEGFWLIKRLLTEDSEFKTEFIEKYGQDVYEKTLKHYSRTNLEQRKDRELREKEKAIKEQAKLEIEKLRAQAYAEQVGLITPTEQDETYMKQFEQLEKDKEILKEYREKHPNHGVHSTDGRFFRNLDLFEEDIQQREKQLKPSAISPPLPPTN